MIEYLFWLDLETSGLKPTYDVPLELAVIVTDTALEPTLWHHSVAWPWHSEKPYQEMDDVVREMHAKSGLLADMQEHGRSWASISRDLASLTEQFPGAYLAGSGVHFDRAFLSYWAPNALKPLHYRNLDVSTLRTFVNLYNPDAVYTPAKAHRAMVDVEDAIAELRHYRDMLGQPLVVASALRAVEDMTRVEDPG
jgi:oligoribonuclease